MTSNTPSVPLTQRERDWLRAMPSWAGEPWTNGVSGEIILGKFDRLERDLRDAWVAELYTPEGADIWIADAEAHGWSVGVQLTRLAQLRDGAFA